MTDKKHSPESWPEFEKHAGFESENAEDVAIVCLDKPAYNTARECIKACAGWCESALKAGVEIEELRSDNADLVASAVRIWKQHHSDDGPDSVMDFLKWLTECGDQASGIICDLRAELSRRKTIKVLRGAMYDKTHEQEE